MKPPNDLDGTRSVMPALYGGPATEMPISVSDEAPPVSEVFVLESCEAETLNSHCRGHAAQAAQGRRSESACFAVLRSGWARVTRVLQRMARDDSP